MRKLLALILAASAAAPLQADGDGTFTLCLRSRKEVASREGATEVVEKGATWDAKRTAVIICDMWDKHTCKNATRRVAEMAPRINALVKAARAKGALIVHAPSDTMKFYAETPQRKLAQQAPAAKPPEPIQGRRHDPSREAAYPIDDTDWCDCETKCAIKGQPYPWTRQHEAIEIDSGDAVSDNGQEIYNLCEQRGITNILICGVHTNMCVLGRSFGIRQMVRLGRNIALLRDLTDCLYDPKKRPQVSHDRGTELMIEHIERYWCPSVLSSEITGAGK